MGVKKISTDSTVVLVYWNWQQGVFLFSSLISKKKNGLFGEIVHFDESRCSLRDANTIFEGKKKTNIKEWMIDKVEHNHESMEVAFKVRAWLNRVKSTNNSKEMVHLDHIDCMMIKMVFLRKNLEFLVGAHGEMGK